MKVAVVGGGPAGLYFARLLRLRDPHAQVTVYERNHGSAATFGFGVGLTLSTMRNLSAADAETAEAVAAASFSGHELHLRAGDGSVLLHGARNLAIGRAALLDLLTEAALAVGVEIRREKVEDVSALDADVVVGADGVGSGVRGGLAEQFGVHRTLGRSHFVWCGADFAVEHAYFRAVRRGDSEFVLHAYPYAHDRSTFLIEVDEHTWRDSGLAALDAVVAPGDSDAASIALLEEVFSEDLRGRPLLTNRTRWSRFTELRLDRWSAGRVVLIGDAAHTAHYTLGSGTKLALEDAIALADALVQEATIPESFARYEALRRPAVERFKALAHRSQAWWESYRERSGWPAEQLALSYMTRSGNLGIDDFAQGLPETAATALGWLGDGAPVGDAADLHGWVLNRPASLPGLELPRRRLAIDDVPLVIEQVPWHESDVWGEEADRALAALAAGRGPVLVTGPAHTVEARVDLAERIKLQTERAVGVAGLDDPAGAATTIAARRADFVVSSVATG